MSKDTLLWKVEMLQQAAAYANSRLHAVQAEVLILAGFVRFSIECYEISEACKYDQCFPILVSRNHATWGNGSDNDRVLPSSSEADKLKKLIKGCRIRKFPRSGHNLLQVLQLCAIYYALALLFMHLFYHV